MRKWFGKYVKRRMLRPTVRRAIPRFLIALTVALLWNRTVNSRGLLSLGFALTILGVVFLGLAWVDYLRLDGVKIPRLTLDPAGANKRVPRAFSDMTDFLDEKTTAAEGLSDDERDASSLFANVICGAILLLSSLLG